MVTTNIHGGQASVLDKTDGREIVQIGEEKSFNYSTLILWVAAAIAICGAAFFWLLAKSTADEAEEKKSAKAQVVAEITSPEFIDVEKKATSFKSAVTQLTAASSARYKLSIFLPKFYEHIKKDITVKNIAVTTDGSISFDGAAANYKSVAEQMIALQDWKVNNKKILRSVDIQSVSQAIDKDGKSEVSYAMVAKINKGASFVVTETPISSTENTDDSISSDVEGGVDGEE